MKVLVISSVWPHGAHSIRAANIVIYEMLLAISAREDVDLGLLVAGYAKDIEIGSHEQAGIDELKISGISILGPVSLPSERIARNKIQRWIFPKIEDFYSQYYHRDLIIDAIIKWEPDLIIIPWSEWLTHICADVPVKKFAYYGNPDPKGARVRTMLRRRYKEISKFRMWLELKRIRSFEKTHIDMMSKYDFLGNVADNDAKYYQHNGHLNTFYIQNMWMLPRIQPHINRLNVNTPIKIIGSIGKVSGTANTLGLEYIANELMPYLDLHYGDLPFELHILGSGSVHPKLAKVLAHPKIIMRGFVDDIDIEIRDSDIFLCVNNGTCYKVGHTRYLHAWSLGIPVVAHSHVRLSMPEIEHNINALLGENAKQLAENIVLLVNNADLRKRLATAGMNTFLEHFTASKVVSKIFQIIGN